MLNKAVFKPFIEKFAFQRNEKSVSYVQLTPDISSNTLSIEIKSMQKMIVSYQYTNIEENDMEIREGFSNGLIKYSDFCKEISSIKARNKLKIRFAKAGVVIEETDENNTLILHMLKLIDDTLISDITKITSSSKDAAITPEEAMSLAYMNDIRIDMEAVPQLNGISLKYEDGYVYFCSSSGSSLHCCKAEIDDDIFDGKEYMIPSVYMKDMLMLSSECVYLNLVNMGNSFGIQFSTSEVSIILPVMEIKKEESIFSNFIKVESMKNAEWQIKLTSEIFEDKQWKEFVKQEVALRKKYNDDKLASFVQFDMDFDCSEGDDFQCKLTLENVGKETQTSSGSVIAAEWVKSPCKDAGDDARLISNIRSFRINAFDFIKFAGSTKNKEFLCTVATDEYNNRYIVLQSENKYLYTPCGNID